MAFSDTSSTLRCCPWVSSGVEHSGSRKPSPCTTADTHTRLLYADSHQCSLHHNILSVAAGATNTISHAPQHTRHWPAPVTHQAVLGQVQHRHAAAANVCGDGVERSRACKGQSTMWMMDEKGAQHAVHSQGTELCVRCEKVGSNGLGLGCCVRVWRLASACMSLYLITRPQAGCHLVAAAATAATAAADAATEPCVYFAMTCCCRSGGAHEDMHGVCCCCCCWLCCSCIWLLTQLPQAAALQAEDLQPLALGGTLCQGGPAVGVLQPWTHQ